MINSVATLPLTICSTVVLIVLLVVVLLLIGAVKNKRKMQEDTRLYASLKPFPQQAVLPAGMLAANAASPADVQEAIRVAYAGWLQSYLLPDTEAGRAFMKIGVEKRRLRYQLTATSLGQGLAMLVSALMGGDDLQAQGRFDRLLAFCLAHPSSDSENLTSWQIFPDVFPGSKLPADFHGEGWIDLSLIAAVKQWGESDRFDYPLLTRARLDTLLEFQQRQASAPDDNGIYTPYFYQAFSQASGKNDWFDLDSQMKGSAVKLLAEDAEGFRLDGSAEDARLGLQVFQIGLAALWNVEDRQEHLFNQASAIARKALKDLPGRLAPRSDEQGGYSALALLACCAPAAMAMGSQEVVNNLWNVLVKADAEKGDSMGATLRLLGLFLLSGTVWIGSEDWGGVLSAESQTATANLA